MLKSGDPFHSAELAKGMLSLFCIFYSTPAVPKFFCLRNLIKKRIGNTEI